MTVGKLGVAAAGLVAALALIADLWDVGIDPITILTVALVAATIYYALKTNDMAVAMIEGGRARQREVQILAVEPFLLPPPWLAVDRSAMTWQFQAPSRPVLDVTITLRARMEAPDPGSSDGRGSQSRGFGSFPPDATIEARIPLAPFFRRAGPTDAIPYEEVWQVELTHHGMLGQWVVETYDWRIADTLASSQDSTWQLRRLQIQPDVPGAKAVDLRFGEA